MYHLYTRSDSPKFWDNNYKLPVEAELKVKILTDRTPPPEQLTTPHMIHSLHSYGLGRERSKEEFYRAIRLDSTEEQTPVDDSGDSFVIMFSSIIIGLILLIVLIWIVKNQKKTQSWKKW